MKLHEILELDKIHFEKLREAGVFKETAIRDIEIREMYAELRRPDENGKKPSQCECLEKIKEFYKYLGYETLKKVIYEPTKLEPQTMKSSSADTNRQKWG